MYPAPPDWHAPMPPFLVKLFGQGILRHQFQRAICAGKLDFVLGGTPETAASRYALLSAVEHVHADCPPTLLMQAADDLVSPIEAVGRFCVRGEA